MYRHWCVLIAAGEGVGGALALTPVTVAPVTSLRMNVDLPNARRPSMNSDGLMISFARRDQDSGSKHTVAPVSGWCPMGDHTPHHPGGKGVELRRPRRATGLPGPIWVRTGPAAER